MTREDDTHITSGTHILNPDRLLLNVAENRLQIDFNTSREIHFKIDLEIDAKSMLISILLG